ncbi:alanine racemase [Tritonibacter multivorans]|uniref:Alanine racemase n=1 Tax=Tritonibacter multivorans TaxID=928856 RepID=A0A0N7LZ54_9RHOB|nr:alanine/ornithine racemase family PLP-dependent enzyme [Tritonibacter multivorans]MDA7421870.1 alanine/ornithine racemase family PLP-dependent enzyme [Tritonibacter multivorans]CUH76713.1 alanine racemase [Tritonibacter multivorans]SFD08027.1 Predicted amino acid racemase [Tritonibacter multivorans]
MTSPRVEIDLGKIRANARYLIRRLFARGISVTGVTKAVCGHPDIAEAMLDGGVAGLADARIKNVVRMRKAGITCPISMIRAPMVSEMEDVIQYCDASYNTEMDTILKLGAAAKQQSTSHDVILMVEMGDMREGILPEDLTDFATRVTATPGVALKGIAANFACMSDLAPMDGDMVRLSRLAAEVERGCGPFVELVSGGGSANLPWALGESSSERVNNLRLGEAILLGTDPVTGHPISGLHTDAFALFAEVIETRFKPISLSTRSIAPEVGRLKSVRNNDLRARTILAVGQQDTNASGLTFPSGVLFIGATSDHTVVDTAKSTVPVGSEMKMGMTYSALMRAMSAPDVAKVVHGKQKMNGSGKEREAYPFLTLV